MADINQVDELKLGISIGELDNTQIKNLKQLNKSLDELDKVLTPDFMKRLEVLSNIQIKVNLGNLKKASEQIKKETKKVQQLATENVDLGKGKGKAGVVADKTIVPQMEANTEAVKKFTTKYEILTEQERLYKKQLEDSNLSEQKRVTLSKKYLDIQKAIEKERPIYEQNIKKEFVSKYGDPTKLFPSKNAINDILKQSNIYDVSGTGKYPLEEFEKQRIEKIQEVEKQNHREWQKQQQLKIKEQEKAQQKAETPDIKDTAKEVEEVAKQEQVVDYETEKIKQRIKDLKKVIVDTTKALTSLYSQGALTDEAKRQGEENIKKYKEELKLLQDQLKVQKSQLNVEDEAEKSGEAFESVATNTYDYINGELVNVKQKIEDTLHTITITTKEKSKKLKDVIDNNFQLSGKSAEESAKVFEEQFEKGSKLQQKIAIIKEKIAKLTKREAKDSEKSTKEEKKKIGTLGKFGKTLGRIALYRAIRATLKQITQTIRQGVQALAQFSPAFNQTMTQFMSAGKNLRMSFVSAIEPIITAVTPFIVNLANTITNINNSIGEALAYMQGLGEYTKVNTEYQEDYNKAVSKLSFDKFDVLQDSSYGGFEKVAIDTEKMAKNASIFENIKSLVETFKEALSSVKEPLKTLWDIIKGLANEYGNEIIAFLKNSISFGKFTLEVLGDILKILQKILESDLVKSTLHFSLSTITSILEIIKGSIITIYEILKSIFTMDFDGLGSRIKEAFDFTSIGDGWKSFGNSFIGFWKKFGNGTKNFFEWLGQSGTWSSFQYYANGGVPDVGTLFYAGEAGAEIVANTGHGTGVMNMEQLRSAVANGMREALYSMRQPNSNETIEIKISDETLFTTVRNSAKRRGLDFANV